MSDQSTKRAAKRTTKRTELFRKVSNGDSLTITLPDGTFIEVLVSKKRGVVTLTFDAPEDVLIRHRKR